MTCDFRGAFYEETGRECVQKAGIIFILNVNLILNQIQSKLRNPIFLLSTNPHRSVANEGSHCYAFTEIGIFNEVS